VPPNAPESPLAPFSWLGVLGYTPGEEEALTGLPGAISAS